MAGVGLSVAEAAADYHRLISADPRLLVSVVVRLVRRSDAVAAGWDWVAAAGFVVGCFPVAACPRRLVFAVDDRLPKMVFVRRPVVWLFADGGVCDRLSRGCAG